MRTPQFASKKSVSKTGWWKHAKPFGKRAVNKSERQGAKRTALRVLVDVSLFSYSRE